MGEAKAMFLTGDEELITDIRRRLSTELEMKDLSMMHYFLEWRCGRVEMEYSLGKRSIQWRF